MKETSPTITLTAQLLLETNWRVLVRAPAKQPSNSARIWAIHQLNLVGLALGIGLPATALRTVEPPPILGLQVLPITHQDIMAPKTPSDVLNAFMIVETTILGQTGLVVGGICYSILSITMDRRFQRKWDVGVFNPYTHESDLRQRGFVTKIAMVVNKYFL